ALKPRTAVFRPGYGATLCLGRTFPQAPPRTSVEASAPPEPDLSWPRGNALIPEPGPRWRAVLERAFSEPDPRKLRRTRAIVIVKDGRLLAERYAPGFGAAMPLCGWSMTKSALNALVGLSAGAGRLSLDKTKLLPEWSSPGDPRGEIRLEDLLRMRSGLEFAEIYSDPLRDVTQMLFARPSAWAFAADKPLEHPAGTAWSYSSGTTNILWRVLRRALEEGGEDALSFPQRALFGPLGMRSAVLEPDAGGDFVFSSFLYASARDWARFGLLYAQDGVWEGRLLLPEGWVRESRTPTPQSPEGRYGAHWWLKIPKEFGGESAAAGRVPKDALFALGHEGQTLAVIPSLGLVAVRMGLSVRIDAWDLAAFLADCVEASGEDPRSN
ncbi:MAG: serine hydrolase, partial [Elusimicrobiota bacterium]